MSDTETNKPLIHITPNAQAKFVNIMRENKNDYKYLRLGVNGSGCSGVTYLMLFENIKNHDDLELDYDGLSVLISRDSLNMVKGANIDYLEEENKQGFVIDNPNKNSTCGHGCSC